MVIENKTGGRLYGNLGGYINLSGSGVQNGDADISVDYEFEIQYAGQQDKNFIIDSGTRVLRGIVDNDGKLLNVDGTDTIPLQFKANVEDAAMHALFDMELNFGIQGLKNDIYLTYDRESSFKLDVEDLYAYYSKEFSWLDFNKIANADDYEIVGGIKIEGGGRRNSEVDMNVAIIPTSINGEALVGEDVSFKIRFDSEGMPTANHTFQTLLTSENYTLSGEFTLTTNKTLICKSLKLNQIIKDETIWVSYTNDGVYEESNLHNLVDGTGIFKRNTSITEFSNRLNALEVATSMFEDCTGLTSFSSTLGSLKTANAMFKGCSSLTSFNSDLRYLENGEEMFKGCKLDKTSVLHIINNIKTYNEVPASNELRRLTLGINNSLQEDSELSQLLNPSNNTSQISNAVNTKFVITLEWN